MRNVFSNPNATLLSQQYFYGHQDIRHVYVDIYIYVKLIIMSVYSEYSCTHR